MGVKLSRFKSKADKVGAIQNLWDNAPTDGQCLCLGCLSRKNNIGMAALCAGLPVIKFATSRHHMMASNRLKTRLIWLGTAQQLTKVNIRTIALIGVDIQLYDTVFCLGVLIDRQLTFADHVKKLAGKCFYQLQQLYVSYAAHCPLTLQRR